MDNKWLIIILQWFFLVFTKEYSTLLKSLLNYNSSNIQFSFESLKAKQII